MLRPSGPLNLTIVMLLLIQLPVSESVSAEQELVLTISGDQIPRVEQAPGAGPDAVIAAHYALLDPETRRLLTSRRVAMSHRVVDYRVAYRSADSAELAEIGEELTGYWTEIRALHAQQFSAEAVAALLAAYLELFPLMRDP